MILRRRTWSFTAGTAPDTTAAPTVIVAEPGFGRVSGVPVASNVTATFSEDVEASTISFVLKAGTTTVASTVTYDVASHTAILDPTANLTPGTTYTVTLSWCQGPLWQHYDDHDHRGRSPRQRLRHGTATASSPSPASGRHKRSRPGHATSTATFNKAVSFRATDQLQFKPGRPPCRRPITYDVASYIGHP